MQRCPSCGVRLEYDPDSCPSCLRSFRPERSDFGQTPLRDESAATEVEPLRSIARFANAAEAGFFAHTLMFAEEVPATIRAEDNFDAVSGYWSTRYHLEVPERLAATAARTLQSLVERSEREDFVESLTRRDARREDDGVHSTQFDGFEREGGVRPRDGIRWGPIVITLAAGSLAFFGLRALKPRADAPPGRQQDLWEQLSRPDRPWVQKLDDRRRREMRFNADRSKAVVREYDGDRPVSEQEYTLPAKR